MIKRSLGEKSFTLIETVIALGLMVSMIMEMSFVQGNAITFSDYGQKLSQALYLGRAVMSEVEYKAKMYPIKEVSLETKDREFDERLCPKTPECEFRYNLTIQTWDLPIVDLAIQGMGGGGAKEDGEGSGENPLASMIKDQIKNILGDDIMKVAHLEVTWPEGARRNSVELAYLFANQKGIDDFVEGLQAPSSGVGGGALSRGGLNRGNCPEGEAVLNGVCVPEAAAAAAMGLPVPGTIKPPVSSRAPLPNEMGGGEGE